MELSQYRTLKLDSTWRPVEVISATDALCLLISGKATQLEQHDRMVHSQKLSFYLPSVIVLGGRPVPRNDRSKYSRRNVFARDHYECQYCGCNALYSLTVDHIVPRSRGGTNDWTNVVTACFSCNQRKGSRTPSEANMKLLTVPEKPRLNHVASVYKNIETWGKYL